MAKTRLNQTHREMLRSFADQAVKCPVEQKARDKAYAKVSDAVRRAIEKQYPTADMAVLLKYGMASAKHIIEGGGHTGAYVRFEFDRDDTPPTRPGYNYHDSRVNFDPKASEAIQQFDLAAAALKKVRDAKITDYKALISTAVTFEDVLDVWPAAAAISEKIKRQQSALVTLSADKIAAIRADNAGAELLKKAA